jgi:acetylornithine deacetylase/succinyl-diaminopimelate desuccinylase-like protein
MIEARSTAALLEELFAFLRIPSISSGDGRDEDLEAGARWVADRVVDAGGSAEVVRLTGGNPLVVGRVSSGRPDAPQIVVYGHYDVQTVAPLEAWTSPPFEPEVRDGFLYARGASDDKGNFHCVLAPLVDLARGGELPVDVIVLSDGEEEIGGDSVVRYLATELTGERIDAAIIFDSDFVERGRPALTTGVRGVATGRFTVHTGTQDAHSGIYGGAALNAAHVLADLISGTVARSGRLPEALEAGVVPPTAEEVESWASLPEAAAVLEEAGLSPLDDRAVAEYYERTVARPTVDVNAITCRDAAHQRTIIPCEASAQISMRFAAGQDPDAVWDALVAHLRALLPPGAELEVAPGHRAAGAAYDPTTPAFALGREAIERATGMPCALVRSGGAIPVIPALHSLGIPALLSGAALSDDNIHAPNERLLVSNYELGQKMGRELLLALGELPPRT